MTWIWDEEGPQVAIHVNRHMAMLAAKRQKHIAWDVEYMFAEVERDGQTLQARSLVMTV